MGPSTGRFLPQLTLMQRFMFRRLLAYTAAVALVLAVVVLLTTTPELFALLGQGSIPFGEFLLALLSLMPMVFYLVGPIAVTVAVGFAYHHWSRNNEIVSLQMAGLTNRALAIPGMAAAGVAMLFTASMSLYLLPVAFRHFEDTSYAAAINLTIGALDEGYLQRIAPNLSLSFRKRLGEDVIQDVTILDGRKSGSFTYIFAERGHFVTRAQPEPEQVLLLAKGSYLTRHDQDEEPAKPVDFENLVLPLSSMGSVSKSRPWRGFFEEHIDRLLFPPAQIRKVPGDYGQWVAEGHKRIIMPLLCLSYVAFALGMLLQGKNPRTGRILRLIALALGVGLWHGLTVAVHSFVVRVPMMIPLYYLMVVVPAAVGFILLLSADRGPRRTRGYLAARWHSKLGAETEPTSQ